MPFRTSFANGCRRFVSGSLHPVGPLLVLVMGAILSPGKRTVSACLRITGRAEATNFAVYHQLLNRARWNRARWLRGCCRLL